LGEEHQQSDRGHSGRSELGIDITVGAKINPKILIFGKFLRNDAGIALRLDGFGRIAP
jgi:hypothetical protein